MKLKILPPTLRINNRYLVLDIKSESKFDKEELISAIWDACIRFYGECETSNFNLWLMRLYDSIPEYHIKNQTIAINNDINTTNNTDGKIGNKSDNYSSKSNHNIDEKNSNLKEEVDEKIIVKTHNSYFDDSFQRENLGFFHQKAILKCQRNYEDKVRGSLATMSNYRGKKIAINTIGISGTISSAKHKFIN